ncbi:hypothetical protein SS1G_13732 [Sclerotinia sclerotiorum 1980 UF-70]|uniref:Uncharacterized protein n=2 Tax=Sclerotinia sclerotiorum (strain ATCC 18683 / 1980 / Ss-1) TaxID=665079 RepID=A7F802_SCLS1|nr:hypothetical protein SS1G_13732 [Sclerotinia sclerotiorum 1980 UF-70]APA14939.1 hypothetical protein sscle_14g097090 [Sclerotinia sclerotiorum 1980 UF-70]EDN98873.1 hypothetical protein SS1G_13732 [Sclerotinia sclerotiorum 1980 UF-70]
MHFQDIAFALFASGAFAAPASLVARDSCSDACYSAYNTCRGAPDANRSSCASSFASCLGYSPYDSNGSLVTPTACSSPVASSTTTAAPTTTADACVSQCNTSFNSCRTAPNANQSYCASSYASCLGYSPFDNSGSLVTPTACSSSVASTTAAATTPTADACVSQCNASYNSCRSAPDANRSYCASTYASCLGYSPFDNSGSLVTPTACSSSPVTTSTAAPTPTADACVSQCNASYNSCRSAQDANRSYCASTYASCLGYSPFDNSGSLVTPTACSSSPVTTSTAAPTTTADACVSQCNASYNSCRSAPDANRAYCASTYASCLGYSPFDNSGSLVTPTACSSSPVTTSTASATSISGIPGGCNPAHSGSCPSSYFSTVTTTTAPLAVATGAGGDQTSVVEGVQWTVKQLTRYCSEDGSGCDYNFVISTNDGRADERCTVIRMPGKDAITESWFEIPCTTGSANTISWGYSDQFGAENAFAVMTVTNNQSKTNAYFGVANVNGNPVTPSSPAGSGNFGDIGPQPVYTF